MALTGCYFCLKYLVFAFNFVFWMLGCALLALGIWAKGSPGSLRETESQMTLSNFIENMSSTNDVSIYFIIVLGTVIMVIGFFGCCGAIRENKCLLGMFFFFLLIIFSALLALGIYVAVHKDKVKDHLGERIEDKIRMSEEGGVNEMKFMSFLQTHFKCCGALYGVSDYNDVDKSQCKEKEHQNPCVIEMYNQALARGTIIVAVAISVALVMILGMIFSMLLICAIREQV